MLRESWKRLNGATSPGVLFVLDASSGAEAPISRMKGLVSRITRRLPKASHRIMFLGGGRAYEAEALEQSASDWFAENSRRLSVLAPVLESATNTREKIVVIAEGDVWDLEDCVGLPAFPQTILVPLGSIEYSGLGIPICGPEDPELPRQIWQPVTAVEIGEPGMIPIFWDNPQYELTDQLCLTTQADRHATVRVCFFGPEDARPAAFGRTPTAERVELTLEDCDAIAPAWEPLPDAEANIVRESLQGGRFYCPWCQRPQDGQKLKCRTDDSPHEKSVFRSLEPSHGFVLVRLHAGRVESAQHHGSVLRLENDLAAVLNPTGPRFHRFDDQVRVWKPAPGRFQQFQRLEHAGAYAIFI